MSYRSADTAILQRAEAVECEISALDAEIAARSAELAETSAALRGVRERIDREGPGGGHAGARRLRIPLLVVTLLGVGVAVLPLQLRLAGALHEAPAELVPAYVISCGPTLAGTLVAAAYPTIRRPYVAGLALIALVTLLFALGAAGTIRD